MSSEEHADLEYKTGRLIAVLMGLETNNRGTYWAYDPLENNPVRIVGLMVDPGQSDVILESFTIMGSPNLLVDHRYDNQRGVPAELYAGNFEELDALILKRVRPKLHPLRARPVLISPNRVRLEVSPCDGIRGAMVVCEVLDFTTWFAEHQPR